MKTELQEKIFNKYPKIFGDRTKPMTETCMCWGLEVGDGWYDLIDVLCEALTNTYTTSLELDEEDGKRLGVEPYIDRDGKASYYFKVEPPQVKASQVKEKYGTLRFYHYLEFDEAIISLLESEKYPDLQKTIDRFSNYVDGIIHFAETASGRTCEITGQPGELHATGGTRSGWLKVVNKDWAKTYLAEHNYVPYSEIPKYEKPDQAV
jgi:hypothetical protein